MHQFLLAEIFKFIFSCRKEFLEIFRIFIWNFNHHFQNNVCENSPTRCAPPCSFLVNNTYYILVDIYCTVLIRRIYISNSRTIISIIQNQCEICQQCCEVNIEKVVLVYFQLTLNRLYPLFMLLLLTLSITCWVRIVITYV